VRNILCDTLVACSANPKFVFLTGDLGYKALEPLQEILGERFINAGVAEQNLGELRVGHQTPDVLELPGDPLGRTTLDPQIRLQLSVAVSQA
jgi:hypothetical protein